MNRYSQTIENESQMHALASQLAKVIGKGTVIFLHGDLGAGKTSFVRGFLQALGYEGKVKSPTYTLVEPYEFADHLIYHFDLYRVIDAKELHHIAIAEYFTEQAITFVEWPEHGFPLLPQPDLDCYIEIVPKKSEIVSSNRQIKIIANTSRGRDIIKAA